MPQHALPEKNACYNVTNMIFMQMQSRRLMLIVVCMLVMQVFSVPVYAANWFKLRGTEPGATPHTIKLFGFAQPTYVKEYNDPIKGAVGPLAGDTVAGNTGPNVNGDRQVPGTIAPDRKRDSDFFLRRARLGARGTLLPVSKDVDYFLS